MVCLRVTMESDNGRVALHGEAIAANGRRGNSADGDADLSSRLDALQATLAETNSLLQSALQMVSASPLARFMGARKLHG